VGSGEVWIAGTIGSGDGVADDDSDAIEAADRRIDAELAARAARQAAAAEPTPPRGGPPDGGGNVDPGAVSTTP
jgi:hypothetical protein